MIRWEKHCIIRLNSTLLKRGISNLYFLYNYIFYPSKEISPDNFCNGIKIPKYIIKYWEDINNSNTIQNELFISMEHYFLTIHKGQALSKRY